MSCAHVDLQPTTCVYVLMSLPMSLLMHMRHDKLLRLNLRHHHVHRARRVCVVCVDPRFASGCAAARLRLVCMCVYACVCRSVVSVVCMCLCVVCLCDV